MFRLIAANRNSALTTEKNDFLIFLGSNFLSINWSDVVRFIMLFDFIPL